MTQDAPPPFDPPAVARKKLTVDFDGGNQTSDAGLLLLRQAEKKLGIRWRLADAMPDRRDPSRVRHAMVELVTAPAMAIGRGHKDGIDFDQLRLDPELPLVCLDETSKQLVAETPTPLPMQPGQPARHDYERNANMFMLFAIPVG